MIPQSFILDLLNRIDIVDAIDRYIPLKKAGANFTACCPFHNEKTPSFTVSQSKQFYHCFGCGVHGNAIGFLMEYGGLSFTDAVSQLAEYAGMQMPAPVTVSMNLPDSSGSPESSEEFVQNQTNISTQDLNQTLQIAAQFYKSQLKLSQKAIDYLKKRGLSGKTAARFGIGYAPPGWQGLSAAFPDYKSEQTRSILQQVGLVVVDADKQYDRFRDRIIFPIVNLKGRIIGFGGRVIEQGEPKYLNSPETALFGKGRELYHLFSARRAIREVDRVIVVEGYMDVIALSQYSIDYAVATLGTAITSFQIQRLMRQTDNIIFCFDGDNAGRKAAWRALENSLEFLSDNKYLSFLFLPEGEDPDSYVSRNGKELFEQQLMRATPLSEFMFKELCLGINLQTSEGRAKLIHQTKPLLQQIKAPALVSLLLKKLEELSGVNQNQMAGLMQLKPALKRANIQQDHVARQLITPYRRIIMMLLCKPGYLEKLDRELLVECDETKQEQGALKALVDLLDKNLHLIENPLTHSILTYFNDIPYKTLLENIESEMLEWDDMIDLEAEFMGAQQLLRQAQRNKRMTELHSKSLAQLTDEEKQELQKLTSF
ncbi:DNA primase [Nitrosomonas sp. PY1]|uniref:DNA primase n=1 Tax=Nitrosomonas sp. PY1 TaxID=1803906 RepID=UPI001FC81EA9|nr:DNA primase [Nitrosomonas sp. PY1]GKS68917.1 DNA primase [Nitrosomonas sp. PY1]